MSVDTIVHYIQPNDVLSTKAKHHILKVGRDKTQTTSVKNNKRRRESSPLRKTSTSHAPASKKFLEDVDYSYIISAPTKRARKIIKPAPPPDPVNQFLVHTPPPTPKKVRRTLEKSLLSPSWRKNLFSHGLDSSREDRWKNVVVDHSDDDLEISPELEQLILEPTREPSLPPNFTSTKRPQSNDAIVDQTEEPEITAPSNEAIQAKAGRFYPIIVGHHAPVNPSTLSCSTIGCKTKDSNFYKCKGCFLARWHCSECITNQHSNLPFHRIERWDSAKQCMADVSLADLGMTIRFDHSDGSICQSIQSNEGVLSVLHTNGVHKLKYHRCTCESSTSRTATPEQLLANKLFPATDKEPRTAFSFEVLTLYDHLDLSGFINIKQFVDGMLDLETTDGDQVCKL